MWLFGIVAFVVVQRLSELVVAHRNTTRLLAQGAHEFGREQYPWIVALHALWLFALVTMVDPETQPEFVLLGLFCLLQLARLWVLASLGRRWTTRVIVMPGSPLIDRGPYKYLKHPNYMIVVAEIAVLPLVFGAWQIALVFTVLNAILLRGRIRTEDKALGSS